MTATLIDGKLVAKGVRRDVKKRVAALKELGITPGLVAVLIGDDPASQTYVKSKERACEKLGIYSEIIKRPADISQNELLGIVSRLNERTSIHGILVQSPLPNHIDEMAVTYEISPEKDVDGFHPYNVGLLQIGKPLMTPCTPYGIIKLLDYYQIETSGKEVVIVGRSNIVGKPIASLLIQKGERADATVTIAHSRTADLAAVTRRADIIVVAVGRPGTITGEMVKEGAVVIDVGVNRIDNPDNEKGYSLVGDVAFDEVAQKAAFITPVPGGVGPMTIAMLMSNAVLAAERSK